MNKTPLSPQLDPLATNLSPPQSGIDQPIRPHSAQISNQQANLPQIEKSARDNLAGSTSALPLINQAMYQSNLSAIFQDNTNSAKLTPLDKLQSHKEPHALIRTQPITSPRPPIPTATNLDPSNQSQSSSNPSTAPSGNHPPPDSSQFATPSFPHNFLAQSPMVNSVAPTVPGSTSNFSAKIVPSTVPSHSAFPPAIPLHGTSALHLSTQSASQSLNNARSPAITTTFDPPTSTKSLSLPPTQTHVNLSIQPPGSIQDNFLLQAQLRQLATAKPSSQQQQQQQHQQLSPHPVYTQQADGSITTSYVVTSPHYLQNGTSPFQNNQHNTNFGNQSQHFEPQQQQLQSHQQQGQQPHFFMPQQHHQHQLSAAQLPSPLPQNNFLPQYNNFLTYPVTHQDQSVPPGGFLQQHPHQHQVSAHQMQLQTQPNGQQPQPQQLFVFPPPGQNQQQYFPISQLGQQVLFNQNGQQQQQQQHQQQQQQQQQQQLGQQSSLNSFSASSQKLPSLQTAQNPQSSSSSSSSSSAQSTYLQPTPLPQHLSQQQLHMLYSLPPGFPQPHQFLDPNQQYPAHHMAPPTPHQSYPPQQPQQHHFSTSTAPTPSQPTPKSQPTKTSESTRVQAGLQPDQPLPPRRGAAAPKFQAITVQKSRRMRQFEESILHKLLPQPVEGVSFVELEAKEHQQTAISRSQRYERINSLREANGSLVHELTSRPITYRQKKSRKKKGEPRKKKTTTNDADEVSSSDDDVHETPGNQHSDT